MKLFGIAQRRARIAALAASALMLLVASSAFAETDAKLPKGYTSDELPALPPPDGAAPASDDATADEYTDTDPSALSDFRQPLSPYGEWVEHDTYGTVWVPYRDQVGDDFAPYQTAGHWEQTDEGEWLWVSYYDWGYIPFHYGRWVWISDVGWAWIPGRTYAPAWVVWRVGHYGYIGWAPMPPAYYWHGGVAVTLWVIPPAAYVFCHTHYIYHHHVHHHVIRDPAHVRVAAGKTRHYKGAAPSSPGAGRSYKPAQPTPADGGISPRAAEKAKGQPDPRAKALSRRSTTPKAPPPSGSSKFRPKAAPNGPSSGFARKGGPPGISPRGSVKKPSFQYSPRNPGAHRFPSAPPSRPGARSPDHRFPKGAPKAAPSFSPRTGPKPPAARPAPRKPSPGPASAPRMTPPSKKKAPAAAPPPPKRKMTPPARSSPRFSAPRPPSRSPSPRPPRRK